MTVSLENALHYVGYCFFNVISDFDGNRNMIYMRDMNLSKWQGSQLLSSGFLKVEMYDNQFMWDIRLKYSWNNIILPLNFKILFIKAHLEDICCFVSF